MRFSFMKTVFLIFNKTLAKEEVNADAWFIYHLYSQICILYLFSIWKPIVKIISILQKATRYILCISKS